MGCHTKIRNSTRLLLACSLHSLAKCSRTLDYVVVAAFANLLGKEGHLGFCRLL